VLGRRLTRNDQGDGEFTVWAKGLSMSAKKIQGPNGQAPHYDLIEIPAIAVGVLLIIALIVVF
jgi:hypothetical protein